MKYYPHCINQLFYRSVCITAARHAVICQVLEARMDQGTPDEPAEPMDGDENDPDGLIPNYQVMGGYIVIPVHGVLVAHASDIPMSSCGCGLDEVSAMIDTALEDANVQTIVFDFRSPGGAVTGIPELGRKIAASTKPTIGFTDSECCSGALWLASQCGSFYCTPSSSVGSIGVWCGYLDYSRQMAKHGVHMEAISAGRFKLLGAYWKALTKEEAAMLQADVDKIHAEFQAAVTARRAIDSKYMEGQIFDGEQAVEYGLADGLVDELAQLLAGLGSPAPQQQTQS